MYDDLRTILSLCSGIAGLRCLAYVGTVISALWNKLRHKKRIGGSLNPIKWLIEMHRDGHKVGAVALSVVLLVGIGYWIADEIFSTKEIGAFFEENGEFEEKYEAYVYIKDKPIFCIVEINKWIDTYEGNNGRKKYDVDYYISSIQLPYGKTDYDVDDYYYPNEERNSVSFGREDLGSYKIEIGPVATERSYELLDAEIVSAHGEFCASRVEDTYHLTSCRAVKNIHDENLVFFENKYEADALQYEFCDCCADRW